MTLNTTYSPAVADGNGVTKQFSYSFNPISINYLKVSLEISGQWVQQLSGWTATVSENGGIVTFDVAPTTRVAIERDVPEEQPTSYETSSGFQAKVIEHSFDMLTGMVQELKEKSDRSVSVEVGSPISPEQVVRQIERVYTSIDNVDAVADDLANVDAVAVDLTNINKVAGSITNVNKVGSNITKVNAVGSNISNVNTVAGDHANIQTVVNNMTAINNAPTYANNSKIWAEGLDGEVAPLGGEHSAKGWAQQESSNYSVTATGTTTSRTLKDRFADIINVKDFGAKGDGVTDDTTAIQAMLNDKGYALFPAGTFRCSTSTFTGKFYFETGAALTVNAGEKITLQGTIQSSKQWIFKGDGDYDIKIASGQIGADKNIHISWFGVFPTNQEYCSAKIQKAIDSFGNTREGVIDFDSGVYNMNTTVRINRGIWLRGSGTRRTVFGGAASDFVFFETAEQAVRITGFQFEDDINKPLRTQPVIWLKHQNCELDDIRVGDKCEKSILVEANNCRIKKILYKVSDNVTYSSSSYIVKIKGDDNILDYVSNAYKGNTTNQTNSIVEVDGTRNVIQNIINYNDSYAVYINPSKDISNNTITGVYNYNANGNKSAIYVTSSHSIDNTTISDVNVYNDANEALKVVVPVRNVSVTNMFIDNVNVYGTCNYIFYLDNQGNIACGVNIGRNIMFEKEPTIQYLYKNGNWNNAVINSFNDNKSPYIKNISIDDDSVYIIDLPFRVYQSLFYLCMSYSEYFLGITRAANNPNYTTISKSNRIDVVVQDLDGTTGADGKLTIGIQDSKIYIENRLGSIVSINFGLLSGIK